MDFGLISLDNTHISQLSFLPRNILKLIEFQRGLSDLDLSKSDNYMLYTGRGPSQGSFHIGHLPGIELIKELQKKLKSKIFFMISDDEKIFRDDINQKVMLENVKGTIMELNRLGLTEENTKFHINSKDLTPEYYAILIRLMSIVSINVLNNIFGEKSNVGEYFYPLYQILPCFLGKQCIIVAGKDQDPFFRLARELARKLGHKPPIILYTRYVPGLDGSDKMSTSNIASLPIFLTDNLSNIKNKIYKVKKVGAGSLDELFQKGANIQEDTLYQLIDIFEKNTDIFDIITKGYTTGFLLDDIGIEKIRSICGDKSIIVKNNKAMLTTAGVRTYVVKMIYEVINF